MHLHPGVEQLHAGLEGGAVEHGLGHALGHDLAVQVFHDEGTDGLLRQGKADLLAVQALGQGQQIGVQLLDALHALLGDGHEQGLFRAFFHRRIQLFSEEIETDPVFEHHGFQDAQDGILEFFLRRRHGKSFVQKISSYFTIPVRRRQLVEGFSFFY